MMRCVGVFGFVVAGILATWMPAPGQETGSSCVACHEMLSGRLGDPAKRFAEDVHAEAGFGCPACHGGDPTIQGPAAMDEAKGYIGRPEAAQIPGICGRCHSDAGFMRQYNPALRVDQVQEYLTSVHGQRLLGAGDTAVANCASCHGPHGILPATDPRSPVYALNVADTCAGCHSDTARMAPYGIPTDQAEKYRRSIHWETMSEGGDMSAPTCNDCHGNHGAAPPGISWVGHVCGQCHVVMAEYFEASRHSAAFEMMGVPGCARCHQNHEIRPASDGMLGMGEEAVCVTCHRPDDVGGQGAIAMRATIDTLSGTIDSARVVLEHAEDSGVEVSSALATLNDARSSLIKARTAVHAFDPEKVAADAEPGMKIAGEALVRGRQALGELRFRRIGLAVAVLIIGALIVGLVLKIKEVEPSVGATDGRDT
ncbi:MAG: cytochrome c3 family protein [Candidatus Palauibacterales bacterium]|nr:cytochrome c3 family protein [Candidatus Palauibacterales bacterium]MDP2482426.1 cytochrome c3 family protein [Candidatus Palauibacterales bacterium]